MTGLNKKIKEGIMQGQFQLESIIRFSFFLFLINMKMTSAQPLQAVSNVDLKSTKASGTKLLRSRSDFRKDAIAQLQLTPSAKKDL